MKPADFGFDYAAYRDCQVEALQWAEQADRQVILLEAPPGVGKSLVGASWGAAFGGQRGWVLTKTLSLMDQYQQTLDLPTIRGAANFECSLVSSQLQQLVSCEDGGDLCSAAGSTQCPYYLQKQYGGAVPLAVTSYAYALADVLARVRRDFLICDEGHNILDVITEWESVAIPRYLSPPDDLAALPGWGKVQWRLHEGRKPDPKDIIASARWRRLGYNLESLAHLDPAESPHIITYSERSLVVRPIWAKPRLWAKRNLVMSATLYGGGVLADLFGLAPGNWDYKEIHSPFDVARRPAYIVPFARINARSTGDDYLALARGVIWLIEQHPGLKGLMHVSSYAQVKRLRAALASLGFVSPVTLLWHDGAQKEARTALFNQFRAAPAPCWLISPSAQEGEDFPYDAARVNAVLKIPYPDLGDPIMAARREDGRRGSDYYAAVTCGNLAQAYGRSMRAEDDWGLTYILDSGIFSLLRYHKRFLPQYFLEAVRKL